MYRGLVMFDLGPLGVPAEKVVGATLEYDSTTKWESAGVASNEWDDILASIWIPKQPWSDSFKMDAGWFTDTDPFPSGPHHDPVHKSWNVTAVVKEWLSGARPNYGFLFICRDESLPAKQNKKYQTTLSNLKLRVLVAKPKP